MKRAFMWILILTLWVATLFPNSANAAQASSAPPSIHAQAAALIDVTSGRILFSRLGDQALPIASLTKIMTAIVAIERGKLTDQVEVSRNAYGKEGSSIYLKLGEKMSLHHMLYGLMLRSGNDAATAIAEHVGGSLEGFVYMMNEKAQELGMTNSHFANPHGLDQEGHYASANDLAKLTAYSLKNPVFQEIVKTRVKRVPNPDEKWDTIWSNKNKMLSMFEGSDGVKTGYTKVAKRCLVSSATRKGQQLAVVTLNDSDDWADHARLLEFGFSQYPLQLLTHKGDKLEGGKVVGHSFYYPLNRVELDKVEKRIVLESENSIKTYLGVVGTLEINLANKLIGRVLIYPESSPLLKEKQDRTIYLLDKSETISEASSFPLTLWKVISALFSKNGSTFRS
jgi:D-alanyl-D-alanine carboxypeptidase